MNDDFERQVRDRLRERAVPDEQAVIHLSAFIATLPAQRRDRFAGRSAEIRVALLGLAAAVIVGIVLLVGLAGRGPSVGASPSPSAALSSSPSSSSSPTRLALCSAGSLAIAGSRQGEVSTVNVGVAITNTGTTACSLGGLPKTVEILGASGVPLALTNDPPVGSAATQVVLGPGVQDAAELTFYWMNWCQASPGELQVRVDFDGRGAVTGPLAGSLLPTCLDPAQASSIQVDGIGQGNLQSPLPGGSPTPSPVSPVGFDIGGAELFGKAGIWAVTNGQILTSTDRGSAWQTVGPWGLSSDVLDADHAWTVTAGPGSTEQNGSSSDILHFVVSRTSDGGRTWTAASVPGSYPETFAQVRFLSPTMGYLLAAAQRQSDGVGTVLRTIDGGATWHEVSRLTWPGSTFGIASDGILWIGANAEAGPVAHPLLLSSRDGGKTWPKAVLPGLEGRTGGADLYVPEPPVFWTAAEGIVEVADSAGPVRLYRTADGGRTWTLAAQRPTGGEGGSTEGGAFLGPTDWLIAEPGTTGEVLVRSTDGGASWTAMTPGSIDPSAVSILSLRFWDTRTGIAVALEGPRSPLLITLDGGASWTQVDGP
jgi:photosystem II stability/assembly factor-like uncharacterized protein